MIKEYDVVLSRRDLSENVISGTKGVVVMLYTKPRLGYEVEFFDSEGETLEVITVYPEDIEIAVP